MKQEPVAWIQADGTMDFAPNQVFAVGQPFYTNPAKTLTDEEILDIWYAMKDGSNNWTRYVDFARAILKKASEK